MSDFDEVLELLLTDPGFAARLGSDPAGTLAGYQLSADEVAVLSSQVSQDRGGQRQVEQRVSKSSLFGLLSSLPTGIGQPGEAGIGRPVGDAGFGQPAAQGFGQAGIECPEPPAVEDCAPGGTVTAGLGVADPAGVGVADPAGVGVAPAQPGFGPRPLGVPADYHTRVDVDGDGHWDQHRYQGRADGGVDIVVDADQDGRAEFVGTDLDRDGLIDRAAVDSDHDGRLDTVRVDDDGDGWLDRTLPGQP